MKYLKTYERKNEPQVGDYVIIKPYTSNEDISNWILNHIGKIIDIEYGHDTLGQYIVKYENIPKGWEKHFTYGYRTKIIKTPKFGILHFSSSKEELELKLAANKYNI